MSYKSTTDITFLETVKGWLDHRGEILVLVRYSHAAGQKDFEFFTSFEVFLKSVAELPPLACVTVLAQPQLPLRGMVDDHFITTCLDLLPENEEHLVIEMEPRIYEGTSWFHHGSGFSHAELIAELEESRGVQVAVGLYPVSLEEGPDTISALVPDRQGLVRVGVY
jgi:hypothetical protein